MNFEQTALLIGVVGKKGNGRLDNGQEWSTDRVELHCLSSFPGADSMSHGQTVIVYNVENYLANYEKAKNCIDQKIVLNMQMQPPKKLGATPKMVCVGFELEKAASVSQSMSSVSQSNSSDLPMGVTSTRKTA